MGKQEESSQINVNDDTMLGRYGGRIEPGEGGRTSDIAAVVVTYNRKDKLLNCIEALKKQKGGAPDILVIDNDSDDGTGEALSGYIDRGDILYRNTGRNIGGAGGFEIGVREAVAAGYKYLWLMDDDCVPQRKALYEFKKAHNKLSGRYGFLSGKVLWKDGSICRMNIQKKDVISKIEDFDKDMQRIQFATFVSCFIRSSVVKDVALPVGEFFIWGDDLEYTRRISLEYPCYYIKDSIVLHDSATNTGSNVAQDSLEKMKYYTYAYRNEFYVFKREGIKGLSYWAVRLLLHLARIAVSGADGKKKRFLALLKGTLMGFFYNPTVDIAWSEEDK